MRRLRMELMMMLGVTLAVGAVRAELRVVNGDFSDLGGLKPHGGHGWYEGVPAAWRSTASAPLYAVHAGAEGKQPACNVSQLGILEQDVGTLVQAADVTLTLDVADVWQKGAELAAEMLDGDGETLASLQLKPGRAQRLVAGKVPAGAMVIIRFKALNGTTPALDNVSVACAAPGSLVPTPRVSVRRFQPDQPLARARRVASVSADLESGSDTDEEVSVTLSLPPGVRLVDANTTSQVKIPAADGCARLTWRLEADAPLTAEMLLELKGADGQLVAHQPLRMLFLPPVEKFNPPYIPEPVPAPASLLVGAHHCPLWESDKPAMWLNVLKHPERTPALGFYSQEQPEVSDWETKWAVEHGISFFIYCWYRTSQGGAVKTRFGSAIHDAFFKSRFAGKMKFTIMWENQVRGQAGVADERDLFTNLLPYWLENYFKHPSYVKVDNKPVLFIYRPEFLVEDLGGVTHVAKAFARMRQVCRDAGFDGLYLLGEYRGRDPKHLALMKSLGLDYTFAYCWYLHGSPTPDQAIRTQMEYIRETQALNILPQVVTVSQAWSGWHDEGTIWKIPPSGFEQLLREAKAFTATLPAHELGSRMLLLDNWNEWGEGHYIAPYREYGFGYLDAVRKVFTSVPEAHEDLLPEDVGRGPYDQAMRDHFARETMNRRQTARKVTQPGAPRGAVAWWSFDEEEESGVALDYSGHRLGGILHKASRAPGYQGRGLVCQGGCVVVPANGLLSLTGPFTIECRVKAECAGQNNTWFLNRVFGGNEASGYRLGVMDGKPCFQLPLTAWSHHLVGAEPLPVGRWVHLAATFDGQTMRLYMDGAAGGALERPGPVRPNDDHLVLGNYEVDHPSFFKGLLDEVRLYRRALPAAEIRDMAHPFASSAKGPPPPKSNDLCPLERMTNQDRVVTPYSREALKEFALPGAPYRMNFIFHDYPKVQYVTPEKIIQEGGGGVVLNDVWDASYLQDDSSAVQVREQVSKLKQAGANVWIYDEQIYPSGSAGGLVLTNNPEYAATGLSQKILTGAGTTNVSWRRTADFERIVGAYALLADGTRQRVAFNRDTVTWAGAEGKWTLHIFVVSQMYEHTPSQVCGLHLKLFNQLSAAATKKFMDVTFEFYKRQLPDFSKTVDAFFMDEPSLQELILNGTLPHAKVSWADNVAWQFYQLHGYDIGLHYDRLFQGDSPNDMAVRCNYRETLASLYAANYLGQMQAWAKKNNTLSSGHLTFEENIMWHVPAYGNLMTALKQMGAPGCDNLAATYKTFMNTRVGLWDAYNWFMAPVYAGSAARMAGKQSYVMTELCPTTDGQDGRFATKADAFKIANLTFKSGVNHINSYAQLWNFKEGTNNYFRSFADYTARMAYMLRRANYDSRVGIYYPIETIQGIWKVRSETLQDFTEGRYGTQVQHALMELVQGCWAAGWDSTLVDAESIMLATVEGKTLVINGVAFEALMLPYAKIMKPEALKKLMAWERAGGKLLFVGERPCQASDPDRHEEVAALTRGRSLSSVSEAVRDALSAVNNSMDLRGENIYASRYDLGDKKMYFCINMADLPREISFSHRQAKGFDLYDNMTGLVVPLSGSSGVYRISENGSVFIVVK